MAITATLGLTSCSSSSRFGSNVVVKKLTPVTLPPGRLRLATSPLWTGSPPIAKTIGMSAVAAFAARAAGSGTCNDHRNLTSDQLGR